MRRRRGEPDGLDAGLALPGAVELAAAHVAEAPCDRLRRVEVDDEQLLLEATSARDHLTRVVEHHRVAVEHEPVLSADEVAEREVELVSRARVTSISSSVLRLADMERRGGEVHEQLCTGESEVCRGRAGLPDVLADRDAHDRIAEPEQDEIAAFREVAVLVENSVVGEKVLPKTACTRPSAQTTQALARSRSNHGVPRSADEFVRRSGRSARPT